jgi:acyl-CoA thioester hydrolase
MSADEFSCTYTVRWADLDPNGQLRHSAYGDYGTAVRMQFLADHGFSARRFLELGFGPVLFSETNQYFKEVLIGETITVTLHVLGRSPDGTRWSIQHDVIKANGQKAASMKVDGAWIDLRARKLTAPPPELLEVMDRLSRAAEDTEAASARG